MAEPDEVASGYFSSTITYWPVLGITSLGALLRLYRIDAYSLWSDEAFSLYAARAPLEGLWRLLTNLDVHPPLYYGLLHFWLSFGDRAGVLRTLSALCGTLAVPLVYCLGRILGGHRFGLLAALFLAISPYNIEFGQQARPYALLVLVAAVAMVGLAWLLQSPGARTGPAGTVRSNPHTPRRSRWMRPTAWLAYVLGTAAALWSHYPAVFLPIAANLVVLILIACDARRRKFLFPWLIAQFAVLILCSPLLPLYIGQSLGPNGIRLPIVAPNIPLVLITHILDMAFFGLHPLIVSAGLELVLFLVCVALWGWRRDRRWLVFAPGLWIAPIVGEFLVSVVWRPIFLPRSLIWTSIPFYLMAGAGLMQIRTSYGRIAFVLFAGISLGGLAQHYWVLPEYESWTQVTEYLAERVRPADLILFNDSYVQLPFDYYFRRSGRTATERGVPQDTGANSVLEPRMTRRDLPRLAAFVRGYRHVWLVYSHQGYTDPEGLVPEALKTLGHLAEYRSFAGRIPIGVFGFEMRPGVLP